MARLRTTPDGTRIPGYCLHKPSGRAYVRINGKHIPLGDYDPTEGSPSMELYRRLIAEWRANGYRTPTLDVGAGTAKALMTVRELTAWFLTWAEEHYSRSEFLLCRQALKELCGLYGTRKVSEVSLTELRVVREELLGNGEEPRERVLGRKTINALVSRIQRAFRNAASEGLMPAEVAVSVCALKPLKSGRTQAPDYDPRVPATWEDIQKVLPILSAQCRGVLEVMWHTAARIGEVCQLRSSAVDRTDAVWLFRPEQHKTQHHGHERVVVIGPRAQAVLSPFLKLDPERYWFNTLDESLAQQRAWESASPEERDESKVRVARPGAVKRESLDPRYVERRLREACDAVGVKFTSHQLRHAALTRIREEFGIESARLIAGQHSQLVTRGYTRTVETTKAARVAKRLG